MTGEPDEDLLDVGTDRSPRFDAWTRWWRINRTLRVAVVVVVLGALGTLLVIRNRDGSRQRAAPVSSPTSSRSAQFPDSAEPRESDEYLVAVPAQDLRAELARCRDGCVARAVSGPVLTRAVSAFDGLRPLAGGTITRHGRLVLQSVEGYAGDYAIAHLTVRAAGHARRFGPDNHTVVRPGYVTTTVTAVRSGCRFTAVLVARASVPSPSAAGRWTQRTSLRCG